MTSEQPHAPGRISGEDYLTRVFQILHQIAMSEEDLNLSEVTQASGLSRPTVHRILSTLAALGLVRKDVRLQTYGVGDGLLELCAATLSRLTLRSVAAPYMKLLNAELKETIALAIRVDDDYYLYVDALDSPHQIRQALPTGIRVPLVRGASGKAILCALSVDEAEAVIRRGVYAWDVPGATDLGPERVMQQVQEMSGNGYVWTTGESVPHNFGVSCAILGQGHRPVGALTAYGPAFRFNHETLPKAASMLQDAAREISLKMRHQA